MVYANNVWVAEWRLVGELGVWDWMSYRLVDVYAENK